MIPDDGPTSHGLPSRGPQRCRPASSNECEPGSQRRELFVLAPRSTDRLTEVDESLSETGRRDTERSRGAAVELAFKHGGNQQAAINRTSGKRIPKQHALGSVDERVGGERGAQRGRRANRAYP